MKDTRQVPTPEQVHSDLRETRKELRAEASAAAAEDTTEIATEAEVRSGLQVEEAERWGGVEVDDKAIHEVMTRAVVDVIVRDEFEKRLRMGRKLRAKLGIDPTGPLLHIGRTVPLIKLRQLQDLGHQVVLIIGDMTAVVGDASDKDAQRQMLSRDQIEHNMTTYKEQIGKILDLDKVEFRYNSQWLQPLTLADVIRLASKFTVDMFIEWFMLCV
ncbi:MAG: tyrosine--tRNA ligase, partial [Chloroflexia bacterium]